MATINSKLKFYIIPNPTPTASDAPFIGRIAPIGVAMESEIAAAIRAELPGTGITDHEVKLVLDTLFDREVQRLRDGQRVNLGFGILYASLMGLFDKLDSKFNAEVNSLQPKFQNTATFSAQVADLVPQKTGAEIETMVSKFDNVVDIESDEKGTVIVGKNFMLLGSDITADAEGEKIELTKADGTVVATATVLGADKGQRIKAKVTSLTGIDKSFSGYVVLYTKGLSGGEIIPLRKAARVVYVAPDPTELDLHMYSLASDDATIWTETPEGFAGTATAESGKMIGKITCDEDPEFGFEDAEFVYDDDATRQGGHPAFKFTAGTDPFESGKTYRATFARRAGKEAEYTPESKSVELVIV